MDASALLERFRVVPVVVLDDVEQASRLAECLLTAGIGCIEVTLRSAEALACIERLASTLPAMLVGVGSIRRAEQFVQAKNAGAGFAVSPGSTPALLAAANMPYLPGVATASESIALLERGYRLQKFFPAEVLGGVAALRALSAPLPEVRFCPTGGVTAALAAEYLALDTVACVGGSWFVPPSLLAQGDYVAIGDMARQASDL